MSSVFIVEYNGKESGTEYYEAWATFTTKEGAEKGAAFYRNRYRKGRVRVRELPLETGEEEKYNFKTTSED
jgi:hypothetical protein